MIYIPANNNMCGALTGVPVQYIAGKGFAGAQFGGPGSPRPAPITSAARCRPGTWTPASRCGCTSTRTARTGARCSTTAGGLVFTGGTNDRKIHAFDAATGKLLWEFVTNSGIVAPPTSFTVDGKQYVAVHAGWGGDPRGMHGGLSREFPGKVPEPPKGAPSGCSRCRKLVAARACARVEEADVAELDYGRYRHIGLVFVSVPLVAHHSEAAEYDATKPVKVTGVVKKVEWTNPHIWFYVEGKDEVRAWRRCGGSPAPRQTA